MLKMEPNSSRTGKRKLPIGIQTFRQLREEPYYVDKTAPARLRHLLVLLLRQLKERDYAAKYRGRGEAMYRIGVEFSRKTRTLAAFEVEPI